MHQFGKRQQLKQVLGTGLHAFAAGGALVLIHHREAIDHMDGIERTGRCAIAVTNTTIGTIFWSAIQEVGRGTGPHPLVLVTIGNVFALAPQDRHPLLHRLGLHPHDIGDEVSHFLSPGHAAGDVCRSMHDGLGETGATGQPAGPAVRPRKNVLDPPHPGIDVDAKDPRGDEQPHSKEKSQRSEYENRR